MTDLTDLETRILSFEQKSWTYAGAKETAIFVEFGWTATRYYQVLNQLIDRPEALAHDPMTVRRLLRLRDRRRRARSA